MLSMFSVGFLMLSMFSTGFLMLSVSLLGYLQYVEELATGPGGPPSFTQRQLGEAPADPPRSWA